MFHQSLRLLALSTLSLCALAACVHLPPEPTILTADRSFSASATACKGLAHAPSPEPAKAGLDPTDIRLLNWNIYKSNHAGLEAELLRLGRDRDILTLQEARLDDELRRVLETLGLRWDLSSAFLYGGQPTGVLSASPAASIARCSLLSPEPYIRIPKASLYTVYPVRGQRERLLLINTHSINFDPDTEAWEQQLQLARTLVSNHRGPVIVAGDFNTWSKERLELLRGVARELGLSPTPLSVDQRTLVRGRHIDHIYTRGLGVLRATSPTSGNSDHNPMLATLYLRKGPPRSAP